MPNSHDLGPRPPSISHLVVAVRNLDASHRFYTELLGFTQCGEIVSATYPNMRMRFYRGNSTNHHDLALQEVLDPSSADAPIDWSIFPTQPGIAHIALNYGTREEWLTQIEFLQRAGVEFLMRGEHGMTHSAYIADPDGNGVEVLYDVPRHAWEGDVNAALNYYEHLPATGPEALQDSTDYVVFPQ